MSQEFPPGFGNTGTSPVQDIWALDLRERHELHPDALLEEIAPVAVGLWASKIHRIEVIELVLGRRVDAGELVEGDLGSILLTDDGAAAYDRLLLYKTIEDIKSGRP